MPKRRSSWAGRRPATSRPWSRTPGGLKNALWAADAQAPALKRNVQVTDDQSATWTTSVSQSGGPTGGTNTWRVVGTTHVRARYLPDGNPLHMQEASRRADKNFLCGLDAKAFLGNYWAVGPSQHGSAGPRRGARPAEGRPGQ